jgi:hypothetical protein
MWQSGGCEGGCRPGEAFSRLDVECRGRAEGEGSGRRRRRPCRLKGVEETRPTSFEGGARVMEVGDEGRWLDLEEIEPE